MARNVKMSKLGIVHSGPIANSGPIDREEVISKRIWESIQLLKDSDAFYRNGNTSMADECASLARSKLCFLIDWMECGKNIWQERTRGSWISLMDTVEG